MGASVAQWIEHCPSEAEITGSNLVGCANAYLILLANLVTTEDAFSHLQRVN